ncbi:hypothetical protein LXL04_026908 [Taraxacum kok-saghyz]
MHSVNLEALRRFRRLDGMASKKPAGLVYRWQRIRSGESQRQTPATRLMLIFTDKSAKETALQFQAESLYPLRLPIATTIGRIGKLHFDRRFQEQDQEDRKMYRLLDSMWMNLASCYMMIKSLRSESEKAWFDYLLLVAQLCPRRTSRRRPWWRLPGCPLVRWWLVVEGGFTSSVVEEEEVEVEETEEQPVVVVVVEEVVVDDAFSMLTCTLSMTNGNGRNFN